MGGTQKEHLSAPAAGSLQGKAKGLHSPTSHLNQPHSKGGTGFSALTVKTVYEAVFFPSTSLNTKSLNFSFQDSATFCVARAGSAVTTHD